jgi:hypothetical protein
VSSWREGWRLAADRRIDQRSVLQPSHKGNPYCVSPSDTTGLTIAYCGIRDVTVIPVPIHASHLWRVLAIGHQAGGLRGARCSEVRMSFLPHGSLVVRLNDH